MNKTFVVGVVLFDRFELLDVAGPLECFSKLPEQFSVHLLGNQVGPVVSAQSCAMVADYQYENGPALDLLVVPGGIGTRVLATDNRFLDWLRRQGEATPLVTSVCTGAGLLAAAGLLDGYRATSNKRSFSWVMSQGPRTEWIGHARWVADRDRWTSAGVSAGIDMTLALIAHLLEHEIAERIAFEIEYDWHQDADWDPFGAHLA